MSGRGRGGGTSAVLRPWAVKPKLETRASDLGERDVVGAEAGADARVVHREGSAAAHECIRLLRERAHKANRASVVGRRAGEVDVGVAPICGEVPVREGARRRRGAYIALVDLPLRLPAGRRPCAKLKRELNTADWSWSAGSPTAGRSEEIHGEGQSSGTL